MIASKHFRDAPGERRIVWCVLVADEDLGHCGSYQVM
jgi:hypothetical protein